MNTVISRRTRLRFVNKGWSTLIISVVSVILSACFLVLFLYFENQAVVAAVLVLGVVVIAAGAKVGVTATVRRGFSEYESIMNATVVVCALAVALVFRSQPYTILMLTSVLITALACLGLNIQFGYTGILNFAGASFLGIGGYTAAVALDTMIPPLLVVLLSGLVAAVVGCILLLPILRTRSHYAALITIAFVLLFNTFLAVNPLLGGPQGLSVKPMSVLGWEFFNPIRIAGVVETTFYFNYFLFALVLVCFAFIFMRRIERSWVGLNMDAGRLDETSSACFGQKLGYWRIAAFTLGNFIIGVAGALYATLHHYVAPSDFTFITSMMLVAIVLLGGIGSVWGVVVASIIIVLLPEKLQMIQEYRIFLFAILVILMLRFRPDGLLPRGMRKYRPSKWGAQK